MSISNESIALLKIGKHPGDVGVRSVPSTRGFTLIELLVVIGLVMVLAALLLPLFTRFKQGANSVTCTNNLRQGYQGLALYAGDNNGNLPPLMPNNQNVTLDKIWIGLIAPYLEDKPFGFRDDVIASGLRCPETLPLPKGGYNFNYSYGALCNDSVGYNPTNPAPFVVGPSTEAGMGEGIQYSPPVKLAGMKHTLILLAETRNFLLYNYDVAVDQDKDGVKDSAAGSAGYKYNGMEARHNGRINFVCADGHVESLPPKKLFANWKTYSQMAK